MSGRAATIARLSVSAYRVPTDAPESDGTLQWDSTTMVLVELEAGDETGLGYTRAGRGLPRSRSRRWTTRCGT